MYLKQSARVARLHTTHLLWDSVRWRPHTGHSAGGVIRLFILAHISSMVCTLRFVLRRVLMCKTLPLRTILLTSSPVSGAKSTFEGASEGESNPM